MQSLKKSEKPVSKEEKIIAKTHLPVFLETGNTNILVVGGGETALSQLRSLLKQHSIRSVTIVAPEISKEISELAGKHSNIHLKEKEFTASDLQDINLAIAATFDLQLAKTVKEASAARMIWFHAVGAEEPGNFHFGQVINKNEVQVAISANGQTKEITRQIRELLGNNEEKKWKGIASKLIIAFALMAVGHIIISYLPLPSLKEIIASSRPYFNYQFLFFILAGFIAQMVDGTLGMGYGVTSATCLMSFGISPVSVSAAIHTSEIFTTGVSGYSHYKFGNVNKKLFKHLVIPGVLGAILGAVLLVFLGEKAGKWLMPVIALYAMFLGLRILLRAFQRNKQNSKIKRIGWLAGAGGFLDSFGGGGWGPIVTSTLIAKGRSPKYTIGSVNLTEFFVTLASAATFFATVGIHHWNIVLGLLIGGSVAAPIAARVAGKLPTRTMMILVGIMVMIWCARMIIKSFV
jgi:siroheme synthase-like protein